MKIVVTGGAGFIGSHLCRRLLNEGHSVIAVDNFYTGRKENSETLSRNKNFTLIEHDIIQPLPLSGIDQIYNLACPASPPAYQKDPIFTWETSVLGTRNMLELARANGNIPILHASTSEIYGDPLQHPQKESYWGHVNPIGLRSCYDEGKRAAETLCFDYYRKFKTPVRVIRIFNTYGPNMDPEDGRVVSNFIMQALRGQALTIYGDGSQTRSFQYIDDLVELMVRMMNNPDNFTGPVNAGNPVEFTIQALAETILKMTGGNSNQIVYNPLPEDDPRQRQPDIALAKEKLGWAPTVKLEEGLKPTINYFKSFINQK